MRTNLVSRDYRCPNLKYFSFGGAGCYAYDRKYEEKVHLKKGDELGMFKLGSTIVLIFEAPADFKFTVGPGDKLKFGQAIGVVPSAEEKKHQ